MKIKMAKLINRRRRNNRIYRGTFVYARPSFLTGIARLFDFGGTLNTYHYRPGGKDAKEADARAIASDWEAVGRDIA